MSFAAAPFQQRQKHKYMINVHQGLTTTSQGENMSFSMARQVC